MVDDKLLEAAFDAEVAEIEPGPALWQAVRERIAPPRPWWRRARTKAFAGVAAAAIVLVTAGVAAAQGGLLWRLFPGMKAPPPGKGPALIEMRVAEAEKEAGFRIMLPTVLPAGVNPGDVSAGVIHLAEGGTLATVGYWTVTEHPGGASTNRVLLLQQLPVRDQPYFRAQNWRTPDGQPMAVTCDQEPVALRPDVPATWFTCSFGGSYLTWVDGGFEFKLSEAAVKLSREQLVDIARSLK